jgi:hypothetical protein
MLAVSLRLGSLPQLSTTPLGKHRERPNSSGGRIGRPMVTARPLCFSSLPPRRSRASRARKPGGCVRADKAFGVPAQYVPG